MRLKRNIFCFVAVCILFFMGSGVGFAQTPDGETPSEETVCDGQVGAAFGLCNAYCEAMDCDYVTPQASEKACTRVLDRFTQITGGMPPCEMPVNLCGNGMIDPGEECDEGVDNGSGFCSATCTLVGD